MNRFYQNKIKREKLTENKKALLIKFISTFLPPTGTKRKYPTTTSIYIHDTLDGIFRKYAGFGVDYEELVEIFLELNYNIFTHVNPKETDLRVKDKHKFYQQVFDEHVELMKKHGMKIHAFNIEVSGKVTRELHSTIRPLPILEEPNLDNELVRNELRMSLNDFFYGQKTLFKHDYPSTMNAVIKEAPKIIF